MVCTLLFYNWIGHGLQSGPLLAFSLWLSGFKIKTGFGFLIKKIRGRIFFNFFKKSKNELVLTTKTDVFGDFSKRLIVFQ